VAPGRPLRQPAAEAAGEASDSESEEKGWEGLFPKRAAPPPPPKPKPKPKPKAAARRKKKKVSSSEEEESEESESVEEEEDKDDSTRAGESDSLTRAGESDSTRADESDSEEEKGAAEKGEKEEGEPSGAAAAPKRTAKPKPPAAPARDGRRGGVLKGATAAAGQLTAEGMLDELPSPRPLTAGRAAHGWARRWPRASCTRTRWPRGARTTTTTSRASGQRGSLAACCRQSRA